MDTNQIPLVAAVIAAWPHLTAWLRAQGLTALAIVRVWHVQTQTVTLTFTAATPEEATKAVRAAASLLETRGFYWQFVDGKTLALKGCYAAPAKPIQTAPALLSGPAETFPRHYVERWVKGPDADRRVRALRAARLHVTTCTKTDTSKLWSAAGADRVSVTVTEVAYTLPLGWTAPAIGEGARRETKQAA